MLTASTACLAREDPLTATAGQILGVHSSKARYISSFLVNAVLITDLFCCKAAKSDTFLPLLSCCFLYIRVAKTGEDSLPNWLMLQSIKVLWKTCCLESNYDVSFYN